MNMLNQWHNFVILYNCMLIRLGIRNRDVTMYILSIRSSQSKYSLYDRMSYYAKLISFYHSFLGEIEKNTHKYFSRMEPI